MTKSCLCYTCDKNYLLPSLVSALQARRNLSVDLADVVVIIVGGLDDPGGAISALFQENNIRLSLVERGAINNLAIHYARHFLDRLLEPTYERIVHIDSDTQIAGSLDPLFEVALPNGMLMAAPDPLAVRIHENGRFWTRHRDYFRSIGIPERNIDRYVNAGIFSAWRRDLADISKECLRIALNRPEPLWFIEQDALNIAFGDYITHISMRWNYPIFFSNCGFERLFQPRVYHFMSNPRPWHGSFFPWGKDAHQVYLDAIAQEPQLSRYRLPMSTRGILKYKLQQRLKRAVEHRSWARPHVRGRLAELERGAIV